MNKLVRALVSFGAVFAVVFLLSGWFITPHLPSSTQITAKLQDPQFWTSNWAGVVLGLLLGLVSARSILRRRA